MTALEELIHGDRGTLERVPTTQEYENEFGKFVDNDEKMRKLLAAYPELLTHYDKTVDSMDHANNLYATKHYLEGLRFGILLGMDIAKPPKS